MDRTARDCEAQMRNATDYTTWREAAEMLDRSEGLEEWKQDESSGDYDWRLIRSRLRQVRQYRDEGNFPKLIYHLRQGLHWNLGNIGNPQLYTGARVGTKHLINEYVSEVSAALEELSHLDHATFPRADKLRFFHEVALSFGRSALMLSGGATLGLFHVGVVKALFREGILPTVLSGSSAGSVVAATVGSRSVEELEELLDPKNAYYHFWRVLPVSEMIRRRAIMDQDQLRRAIGENIKDLTFEQAHKLSGKIINITVSPAGINQPPRLLNYLTFPYLYLREAVLASCAVPVLFPPVMLMTRDQNDERVPYMPLLKWNDGSLKSDLPTLRIRRLHNVNHFIVSQTNPHVLPFVSKREPGSKGLVNSTRDYAFSTLRQQAKGIINFARASIPLGDLHKPLETAASILDQEYRGNINIYPNISLWRYANITKNPDLDGVQRFILEGERATWPRIEMIRTQTMISLTLDRCVERLEHENLGEKVVDMPKKPGLRMVRRRDASA
jgi:TAG lipase/steryl ester hydrolase/phospholipase A2/LPA acyltransferase